MPTGRLDYNSPLIRKAWMREGLIQAASKSFWTPITGNSPDSIVYQAKLDTAKEGHTVTFDFSGNQADFALKNRETAYGQGKEKLKFSDNLTINRYRMVIDNGDEYDATQIADLQLTTHADSRRKLADMFIRFKDQGLFDAAQGHLVSANNPSESVAPTHIIDTGTDFTYNTLYQIGEAVKSSSGYQSSATMRRPLKPYTMDDGRDMYYFIIDSKMALKLQQDSDYQTLFSRADNSGPSNRIRSGTLGTINNLIIVEAPNFFGATNIPKPGSGDARWGLNNNSTEISGLRRLDGNGVWTGQPGYVSTGAQHSRGLVLGAGALQIGYGRMPDYKMQPSIDFGITSESALEVWMDIRKCKLKAEVRDYDQAKVAGHDHGVIAVDVQTGS